MTPSPLAHYTQAGQRCSRRIIRAYSSSFSLASLLLAAPVQRDIESLYALVRVADELVDGVGAEAGLSPAQILQALTRYEQQTVEALTTGFSTDPIVHSFATMARRCHIPAEHIQAFFASMRDDIPSATDPEPQARTTPVDPHHTYDPAELERYIYGSAEVIGLMCLAIFLTHDPFPLPEDQAQVRTEAARKLGAAFQKINFLRDYADDTHRLHRYYMTAGPLTDATKAAILATIREDLACAQRGLELLPSSARRGVHAAFDLFAELTEELEKAPAQAITHQRLRVNAPRKALITARALWRERR